MPSHDDYRAGGPGVFLTDNSEKLRLGYWQKFSTPIPADLLRITGWLSQSPDRVVVSQVGGKPVAMRAADAPPNVLFRLPDDPKSRAQWDSYLHFLRLHQSRVKLVEASVARAKTRLDAAATRQQQAWDAVFEADQLARFALDRARAPRKAKDQKDRDGWIAQARIHIDDVRTAASTYRMELGRLHNAERAHAYYVEKLQPQILPGIWAEINAFLDMQCLTTASLASDEFRKRPRGSPRSPGPASVQEALGIDGGI
jgi:hypothetical protein